MFKPEQCSCSEFRAGPQRAPWKGTCVGGSGVPVCTACWHGTPRPREAVYHAPRVMRGAAENTRLADGLLFLPWELTLSWELIKTHGKESEDPKNRAQWGHGQGPQGGRRGGMLPRPPARRACGPAAGSAASRRPAALRTPTAALAAESPLDLLVSFKVVTPVTD